MAGTINFAMTQQFSADGVPLSGGQLFFFAAGTTTPQSAFQDLALTIAHQNPIILDASGRVPMFYLADGFIKIRLADKNGVTIIAADQLLVIGPSSGSGGGGGSVDATTVLATGDIKARYGTGTLTGFVRCNGNTIGKTGSGASELASDTLALALYTYLWPFPNITLTVAKGANANADFTAGKLMNLPDLRGRAIAGMDDMGATAANRLTVAFFGAAATVLGAVGGSEKIQLAPTNLPSSAVAVTFPSATVLASFASSSIAVAVTGTLGAPAITTAVRSSVNFVVGSPGAGQSNSILTVAVTAAQQTAGDGSIDTATPPSFGSASWSFNQSALLAQFNQNVLTATATIAGSGNASLGTAFATAAPAMVLTFYIKL